MLESRTTGDTSVDRERIGRIETAVERLRPEMIGFLQQLVQIPSQTREEGAVQAAIAQRFRADGFETAVWEPDPAAFTGWAEHVTNEADYRDRPNVTARWAGAGDGQSLILCAHIDTVETGDRAQWTRDPLGGEIIDGELYGRGACDMKGGLVTNLFALLALRDAGYAPLGDVHLHSVVSEEDGGAGALAAVLRGPRADAAIITEPTRRAIVPAQGGSLMFRISITGRSAHACVRDEGHSAVEAWAVLHQGLLAFEAEHNRQIADPLYAHLTNKAPINVGTLRAGSWRSSVPEWLVEEGRAGLIPGEPLEEFKAAFAAAVAAAAARDAWLAEHPPVVEWLDGQFAPAGIAVDHELVRTMVDAHRAITGEEPPVEGVTYGADLRHYVLVGGIPCAMYGAGDVRLAHAPDERIGIDELAGAVATLAETVARWCGVRETPAAEADRNQDKA